MTNGKSNEAITLAGPQAIATHETAASAAAAQAEAQVKARYALAVARPRDIDDVRSRLLKECKRPGFARVARYNKPIGKGVEGPSIRFAEAAIRIMGNIMVETPAIYDDAEKRIVRVIACDLETNATYSKDITVRKVVERRKLQKGQTPISSRTNSAGYTTYLVEATDDDILNKENALISKAIRTCALRLVPGDVLEECMDQVFATMRDDAAQDPDAERKRLIDAFSRLNITPADLKAYLGHDLSKVTPAGLVDLRALYMALNDGELTWAEAMESRGGDDEGDGETDKKAAALRDKLSKKREQIKSKGKPKDADPPPAGDENGEIAEA